MKSGNGMYFQANRHYRYAIIYNRLGHQIKANLTPSGASLKNKKSNELQIVSKNVIFMNFDKKKEL